MSLIYKYGDVWIWSALVLIIHSLATLFGVYYYLLWFDSLMHFLGGISIALGMYFWLQHERSQPSALFFFLIVVGTAALAAVLWEFAEFLADNFLRTSLQPGLEDTLKDLWIGISSATITAIIILYKTKTRK